MFMQIHTDTVSKTPFMVILLKFLETLICKCNSANYKRPVAQGYGALMPV